MLLQRTFFTVFVIDYRLVSKDYPIAHNCTTAFGNFVLTCKHRWAALCEEHHAEQSCSGKKCKRRRRWRRRGWRLRDSIRRGIIRRPASTLIQLDWNTRKVWILSVLISGKICRKRTFDIVIILCGIVIRDKIGSCCKGVRRLFQKHHTRTTEVVVDET